MTQRDLKHHLQIANGINATLSGTTPSAGNIIDLQGVESATFCFFTGTVTDAGTAAGFSVAVQESDTTAAADFTAVADIDLLGLESDLTVTLDTADDDPIGTIGYVGSKRYIRVVATGTTGTDAAVYGVWLKSHASIKPPTVTAADIAAT